MYISKVVSNYMYFFWGIYNYLRYLTCRGNVSCGMHLVREIYLSSICLVGKVSVGDVPGTGNVRRAFDWSGKCPSGMCLFGEVSFGGVSSRGSVRRGSVWSGKCPSGMCLVGEVSVGDVSGQGSVCRGNVCRGSVLRGIVALLLSSR